MFSFQKQVDVLFSSTNLSISIIFVVRRSTSTMKMSLLAFFFASSPKKQPALEVIASFSTLQRSWLTSARPSFQQHYRTRSISSTTQLGLLHSNSNFPSWQLPPLQTTATTAAFSFAPITTRAKVEKVIQTSIARSEKINWKSRLQRHRRLAAAEGDDEEEPPKRVRGPRRKKNETGTKLIVVDSNVKKLRKLRDGGVFRADRVLANRGWGTRSDCFQVLVRKQVAILETAATTHQRKSPVKENGNTTSLDESNRRTILGPMERIPLHAKLFVRGQPVPDIPLLMAYHKPKWMLSTMSDPQHPETTLVDKENETNNNKNLNQYDASATFEDIEEAEHEEISTDTLSTQKTDMTITADSTMIESSATATTRGGRPNLGQVLPPVYQRQKLHPVGRLDYDSSGLILFSSLGTLTQKLLHPSHQVEKEYQATVSGNPNLIALERQLAEGVATADGVYTARLLSVNPVPNDEVPERLQHIIDTLPPEYDRQELEERGYLREVKTASKLSHVRLVVTEGKHRMVRRMLANIGYPVLELKRLRQGVIGLGDLPEGQFRFLTPEELEWAETLLYKQWMKNEKGNMTVTTVPRKPKQKKQEPASSSIRSSSKNATTRSTSITDVAGLKREARTTSTAKSGATKTNKSKAKSTSKGKR
jgi:23S rRNA pseudouridine2605 synthase